MDPAENTEAILRLLGERLRQERLRDDISQRELAERAGVSERTVKNAEGGKGITLETFVELLRALGRLSDLDELLTDAGPSPIDLADRGGQERRRASGSSKENPDDEEWNW